MKMVYYGFRLVQLQHHHRWKPVFAVYTRVTFRDTPCNTTTYSTHFNTSFKLDTLTYLSLSEFVYRLIHMRVAHAVNVYYVYKVYLANCFVL